MTRQTPISDDELARLIPQALALPEPPLALTREATALWPGPAAALAQAALRLVRAVLRFDSWAQPAAALSAVRHAAAATPTRHLLFSVQGRDIDLRISPEHELFVLSGQVLGPDEAGVVTLSGGPGQPGAELSRLVPLDTLGEFHLAGVSRGTYRMTLRLAGEEIELPPIDVGGTPSR